MNRMVWLIPFMITICVAGNECSCLKKEAPPTEQREIKLCTVCEQNANRNYISYCNDHHCPAVMCNVCEALEMDNSLAYDRKKKLFFVSVMCTVCSMQSRLYENDGTPLIRKRLRERAKKESYREVYQ